MSLAAGTPSGARLPSRTGSVTGATPVAATLSSRALSSIVILQRAVQIRPIDRGARPRTVGVSHRAGMSSVLSRCQMSAVRTAGRGAVDGAGGVVLRQRRRRGVQLVDQGRVRRPAPLCDPCRGRLRIATWIADFYKMQAQPCCRAPATPVRADGQSAACPGLPEDRGRTKRSLRFQEWTHRPCKSPALSPGVLNEQKRWRNRVITAARAYSICFHCITMPSTSSRT